MGTFTVTMKTHSREDITSRFMFIHDCVIHKKKPQVLHIVAGRNKEDHYVVTCGHDDCTRISMDSPDHIVTIWNNYNPLPK